MLWPPKHSYKEFDNEKNSCGSKIPLPPPPPPPPAPHNFSNGPSLRSEKQKYKQKRIKPPSTEDKGVV